MYVYKSNICATKMLSYHFVILQRLQYKLKCIIKIWSHKNAKLQKDLLNACEKGTTHK